MTTSEQAIRNLLYHYAELQDAGDFEGVGALFAHGVYQRGDGRSFTGPELTAHRQRTGVLHDGVPGTKHVTTNITVDVDEEHNAAVAESYFSVFQGVGDHPLEPIAAGRYHDHFERIEGDWRFVFRRSFVDLEGDMEAHRREG